VIGGRGLQFAFVDTRTDLEALRGRPALFIDSAPHDPSPGRSGQVPEAALRSFASCEELDPIVIGRGARVLRKFFVYRCLDYRGPAGR
jgi:hypothetical protein